MDYGPDEPGFCALEAGSFIRFPSADDKHLCQKINLLQICLNLYIIIILSNIKYQFELDGGRTDRP